MKHILLLGAGKSATVLIDFLKVLAAEKNWMVTVADASMDVAKAKTGTHPNMNAVALNIEDITARKQLIGSADVVISLMPPHLHYQVALDCLELNKNLLTASYIDEQTKALAQEAKDKGLLFLYEMGLDPGIDHMSAMQIIDDIKAKGGTITSFKSHCGGLVAPESDDNPWHYKISWNPRNVVMAGKAGATYLENGIVKQLKYEELFAANNTVELSEQEQFAYYPNRDSLGYIPVYHLEGIQDFVRTTLRYPEFCFGWKNIIELQLTNEDKIYQTDGMSVAAFFKQHFDKHGFNKWIDDMLMTRLSAAKETMERLMQLMEAEEKAMEQGEIPEESMMLVNEKGELNTVNVDDIKDTAAEQVAASMSEANLSMKQLFFLGLDDNETLINLGLCSAADVLQFILEKKLVLQPQDKDMIVMMHEFEYELNGKKHGLTSILKVIGKDSTHTAMAKTVGLPLGIAAELILEGKITDTGLHIPISEGIYNPVLEALKKYHIVFEETDWIE